ncbi:MAG: ABC transporter substrate-binding protein [Deltaproteobacteria bacterium]|nr:ABC transporter substrate-binding protein [Deltaproteobacteria bacterium]
MFQYVCRHCLPVLIVLVCASFVHAKGDTLTAAFPVDPKTMDPHATQDSASHTPMRQIYESLVTLNEKGVVVPVLAEKWEALPGNKGYTFHLKKGVRFHNGEVMKADDVIFTFQRAAGPEGSAVHSFSNFIDIANVKALDDHTVVIPTKQPMGTCFLESMNHPWSSILSRKAVETTGKNYGQNPVGTGRFKLASWAKGDKVTMERFEDYHGEKAKLKKLVIRTIIEGASRVIELESGAIDVAGEIPQVDVKRIQANPALDMVIRPGQVVAVLSPDITKPPYDNLLLRKAMDIAIDREGIAKTVYRGYAEPSNGPITAQIKYSKHKTTPIPKVDVPKAKELLKQAGYPNGLKGTLITPDRSDYMSCVTVIQENLRAIGMEMELKVIEWGAYLDVVRQPGHAPYFWYHWGGAPALDPFFPLTTAFHSSAAGQTNRTFLKDPEIDALLDKGAALDDGPERQAVYEKLWDKLNDMVAWINVVEPYRLVGTVKGLKGVHFTPSVIVYYGNAYFEK